MSTTNTEKINPLLCPICGVSTNYVYRIVDDNDVRSDWYRCQCGVIFQKDLPAHDIYDSKYIKNYNDEKLKANHIHAPRTYLPLIEELTYGRMALDVGFGGTYYNMEYFTDRGWLYWGVDTNDDLEKLPNIYRGDFETFDFTLTADQKELAKHLGDLKIKDRTFDLIWMSHVFEHFQNPVSVLRKAHNLLSETGVLYIAVPDIEFINKTGVGQFPHWKAKEHYILWSKRALIREVEKAGFEVVLCRRNFASRFISWYDIHLIAQKRYF